MLHTVELRWFFSEVPVDRSLQLAEGTTECQERSDWYAMPCHPLCGIKLREGRLETKLRFAELGQRTIDSVTGYLEAWRKWSLEFPENDSPTMTELETVGWLEVAKTRYLQRFEVREQQVQPSPTRPENGCEFEITQLRVRNRIAWTVGFEAVGPEHLIEANLQQVVRHVLQRHGLQQPFAAGNSFGYPQWLTQFADLSAPLPLHFGGFLGVRCAQPQPPSQSEFLDETQH